MLSHVDSRLQSGWFAPVCADQIDDLSRTWPFPRSRTSKLPSPLELFAWDSTRYRGRILSSASLAHPYTARTTPDGSRNSMGPLSGRTAVHPSGNSVTTSFLVFPHPLHAPCPRHRVAHARHRLVASRQLDRNRKSDEVVFPEFGFVVDALDHVEQLLLRTGSRAGSTLSRSRQADPRKAARHHRG